MKSLPKFSSKLPLILLGIGLLLVGIYIGRKPGNILPSTTKKIIDSQVNFLAQPKKIAKLGIMAKIQKAGLIFLAEGDTFSAENNSTYYEIGTMKQAPYQGKKLILIQTKDFPSPGPGGNYEALSRFIVDNSNFILLQENSDIYLETYKKTLPVNLKIESEFKIKSLEKGKEVIAFKYKGHDLIFQKDWPTNHFSLPAKTEKIGALNNRDFYREKKEKTTKPIFKDFGKKNKFFLELPDLTFLTYTLSSAYVDSFPQKYFAISKEGLGFDYKNQLKAPAAFIVNWTDGLKPNQLREDPYGGERGIVYSEFIYHELFGNLAGMAYYDNPVNLKAELIKVGSNKAGEEFFALNDKQHLIYTDFYAKRNEEREEVQSLSYEEFLGERPVFFWKDIFGDYHAFFRLDFEKVMGIAKPAIYLYSPEKRMVKVVIDPALTEVISIPEYKQNWQVETNPEGIISYQNQTYDYLFYEGNKKDFAFRAEETDFVKKENIKNYLGLKLKSLGLNQKESQQFIDYWQPKMGRNDFYQIDFMMTEALQKEMPLLVSPQPETLIRILMRFKGLAENKEEEITINPTSPLRKGFTVVEWGGVR